MHGLPKNTRTFMIRKYILESKTSLPLMQEQTVRLTHIKPGRKTPHMKSSVEELFNDERETNVSY